MSTGPIPALNAINGEFWEGTRKGELRLRRCNACGTNFRFIREICPRCWSDDIGWTVASGIGKIIARATVHYPPYEAMEARVPYVIALVQLSEGVTMMANVVECDPAEADIGRDVRVIFEERGDFMLPQFVLDRV